MAVTKPLSGFRFVEIRQDDTLQRIAQRELGDTSLWWTLIDINDLTPPYLTGDPNASGPKVKLYGELLVVPASEPQGEPDPDAARIFGVDVLLRRGRLESGETGDLAMVSGHENLKQALVHRFGTALGELLFHPTYGCGVHALKGEAAQPGIATLAAQYARSAALSDPRVQAVSNTSAKFSGDALAVTATVTPITGGALDIFSAV